MASGSGDLISVLPDPLLCHILSFLPTKEAASTSVLSRRWRYLLAFVHNLDFDDSVYMHREKRVKNPLGELGLAGFRIFVNNKRMKLSTSFPDFVDRILDLQANFTLHKFSLKIVDGHDPVDRDFLLPWIHKVLGRGVFDLHLEVNIPEGEWWLPTRIFLSETLVKLKIKIDGYMPDIDVEDVHLPKLKSLYLESVMFTKDEIGFTKLLCGCPVLEELVLYNICSYMWNSFSVSVPTLKRLTFRWEVRDDNPTNLTFDTPNLVYLEYTEVVADKYLKMNFDSLVEAKLDLRMTEDQIEELRFGDEPSAMELEDYLAQGNATDFIMGIRNVQILYLSANTLETLMFCCKAIPLFSNLAHLTIESDPEVGWEPLPILLKNCPNLQTLVFQGLLHRATSRCADLCLCKPCEKVEDVSTCLSSSPVKILKILKFDMEKEMEQVKYFLKTMPNLEQLIIHYGTSVDEHVVEVLSQFQMVSREGLTKCEIQVISENLSLYSST